MKTCWMSWRHNLPWVSMKNENCCDFIKVVATCRKDIAWLYATRFDKIGRSPDIDIVNTV